MNRMKMIAMISAACLVFTGMTAALPASAEYAAAADTKETETAKSVSFDEATGTLTLRGNVDRDDVMDYRQNEAVKKVVCAKGTVLPPVCAYMFDDFCAESIDLSNADTSNVENMACMFSGASAKAFDLSSFNTAGVTTMASMFYGCQKVTALDLSSFDTARVTDMTMMFSSCSKLTDLNIRSFDTSSVQKMSNMFAYDKGLKSLDLSHFKTSKVREMGAMFLYCTGLTELDLSAFDTSSVQGMSLMFYECSGLTRLDLRNFNTSNVITMAMMFSRCSGLTELNLTSFDTSSVTAMGSMFWQCSKLTELDLSSFETASIEDMPASMQQIADIHDEALGISHMFEDCPALKTIYVSEKWQLPAALPHSRNIFGGDTALAGGNGTAYADAQAMPVLETARIDREGAPGLLTYKESAVPAKGDFDGNGTADLEDAQRVLSSYAKDVAQLENTLTARQQTAADVDGDGRVSVEDAQYILRYYTEKHVAGKNISWNTIMKPGR